MPWVGAASEWGRISTCITTDRGRHPQTHPHHLGIDDRPHRRGAPKIERARRFPVEPIYRERIAILVGDALKRYVRPSPAHTYWLTAARGNDGVSVGVTESSMEIVTVVPQPRSLVISSCQPWSFTRDRVSKRPSPVPSVLALKSWFERKNGVPRFSRSLSAMPIPVSLTSSSPSRPDELTRTVTSPPAGVNFTALLITLARICLNARRSASSAPNVLA